MEKQMKPNRLLEDLRGNAALYTAVTCLWICLAGYASAADRESSLPKRLNNFTWELLQVQGQVIRTEQTLTFTTPKKGWVYLRATVKAETGRLRFSIGEDSLLELGGGEQTTKETMRQLPAGEHRLRIQTDGAGTLDRLVIRSIPAILLHNFTDQPSGRFETTHADYLEKHIIPSVNTFVLPRAIVVGDHPLVPLFHKWRNSGRIWLSSYNSLGTPDVGKQRFSADEAFDYISSRTVVTSPLIDGTLCDEFVGYNDVSYSNYAEAFRRLKATPRFKDKLFWIYMVTIHSSPHGRALANSIIETGGVLAWERYLTTKPTEAAARAYLREVLVEEARHYREQCPGSIEHMAACFGFYSKPGGHLANLYPGVNHKVWLDMQFHLAANDPAFRDLHGLMGYHSAYSDEETLRWMCHLFRHYGIEGRKDRATSDPYISPHLTNGDFVKGLDGWTIDAAEDDSVRAVTHEGLGFLQARDGKPQGDTALLTVRSAKRPNRVSQELRNLEPGRLYTFRMMTANYDDLSKEQKPAVGITIEDVTRIPAKSFSHRFHNPAWRKVPPYDGEAKKAWHTYHWHVFRARQETARITITDWSSQTKPGGPVSRRLVFNYIQVHPYFESKTQ